MIITVTLNPAIDKMIEVEDFQLGKVHRLKNIVKNLGGKSINVSRILVGLNVENEAICFAGLDNLEEVKRYAKKDKINLQTVEVFGTTRTNVKMIEPQNAYRTTDLNEPGFSITKDQLSKMTQLIEEISQNSDYLVLSGSLPIGVEASYYGDLAKILKQNTKVVIDADDVILANGIKGSPYIIKPNIHELESVLGKKLNGVNNIARAARELLNKNKIKYSLVSLGSEGSILVSKDIIYYADIIKVKAVNTVGAGDSMLAGFLFGLVKHENLNEADKLHKAMSYGVASSTLAISQKEHINFTEEELLNKSREVKIDTINID